MKNQKRKRRPRPEATGQAPKLTKKQRRESKRQDEVEQKESAEMRSAGKKRLIKRMMGWSGLLLGLILAVLGLIYFTDSPEPEAATRLANSIPAVGWTVGNPAALITLVEFSDYQCPTCARYHDMLKRLTEELGDDFQLIFRHYPLQNHRKAELAARSAEAAGRQGKFWEMHDLLFAQQESWSKKAKAEAEKVFVGYAASLNLDVKQFQSDLSSPEVIKRVINDAQEGQRSGVTATPTFFLNGEKITQKPRTYEGLRELILENKTHDQ